MPVTNYRTTVEFPFIIGSLDATVYFDYSPPWTAPHSGTSMAESPDEPEEIELLMVNIFFPLPGGDLSVLNILDRMSERDIDLLADTIINDKENWS